MASCQVNQVVRKFFIFLIFFLAILFSLRFFFFLLFQNKKKLKSCFRDIAMCMMF